MFYKVPNLLTLSRIIIIPLFVFTFYWPMPYGRWIATLLFVYAGLTDYLDGYFARIWQQTSVFGRFLDPIADKLIVAAALIMLVETRQLNGVHVIPVLLILCREILVSGLREYLGSVQVSLPVSRLAKWKTALQMAAITGLILGDAAHVFIPRQIPIATTSLILLWISSLLTLTTGYSYLKKSVHYLEKSG